MNVIKNPQPTLATKLELNCSGTCQVREGQGREQKTRGLHRRNRTASASASARNHHPTQPNPPRPRQPHYMLPSQCGERKSAASTAHTPRTPPRHIYRSASALPAPTTGESCRRALLCSGPRVRAANSLSCKREEHRADRHGEVAVLREGAHQQGGLDQGGGPAADRLHQGQRRGLLALAAQGGRPAALRQELPPPLDELPPPRPQARQLHRRRGRPHHPPPQPPRQQVVSHRRPAAGQDGQRDQELLEHAHQAQAPLPRHGPSHAPSADGRRRRQHSVPPGTHSSAGEGGATHNDFRPPDDEAPGRRVVVRRRQQRRDEHGRAAVPRPQPRPLGGPAGGRHADLAPRLPLPPPGLPRRGGVQLPPGRQPGLQVAGFRYFRPLEEGQYI